MTGAMAAFGMAVGGASLICYALITRSQNSRRMRRPARNGSAPDASNYATGEGWTHGNGVGGHSMLDGSGNPTDSGAGDSGGGGDGGGGGGDGGGGGGGSD